MSKRHRLVTALVVVAIAAIVGGLVSDYGLFGTAIVMGVLLVVWVVVRPEVGLYALIVSLPVFYVAKVKLLGLTARPFEVLAAVMLPTLIVREEHGTRRTGLPLWRPVLVYLLSVSLSIVVSVVPRLTIRQVAIEVLGFATMWSVYYAARDGSLVLKALKLLLWLGVVDAFLIILNTVLYVTGLPTFLTVYHTFVLSFGRPNALLGEPDRTAEFHLILLLITIPLFLRRGGLPRYLGSWNGLIVLSFWVNLYIVLIGVFRAALLGLGVGVLAYYLTSPQRPQLWAARNVLKGALAISVLCSLVFLSPVGREVLSVFQRKWSTVVLPFRGAEGIEVSELRYTLADLERALQSPVFGNGYGTEVASRVIGLSAPTTDEFNATTSRLVSLFYGAGAVGVAGFMAWQLALLRTMGRLARESEVGMALFLPVVGVFWGHDLFRAVPMLLSMMVVVGLGLAWGRTCPSASAVRGSDTALQQPATAP